MVALVLNDDTRKSDLEQLSTETEYIIVECSVFLDLQLVRLVLQKCSSMLRKIEFRGTVYKHLLPSFKQHLGNAPNLESLDFNCRGEIKPILDFLLDIRATNRAGWSLKCIGLPRLTPALLDFPMSYLGRLTEGVDHLKLRGSENEAARYIKGVLSDRSSHLTELTLDLRHLQVEDLLYDITNLIQEMDQLKRLELIVEPLVVTANVVNIARNCPSLIEMRVVHPVLQAQVDTEIEFGRTRPEVFVREAPLALYPMALQKMISRNWLSAALELVREKNGMLMP